MDNPLHKDMMILCVFTYVTILKRTYHQIYGKSDSTTSHIKRSMLINGNTKKKIYFLSLYFKSSILEYFYNTRRDVKFELSVDFSATLLPVEYM